MYTQNVQISEVTVSPKLQLRLVKLKEAVVKKYCKAMKAGAVFPPITIIKVGSEMFVVDGFHRLAATEMSGNTEIDAVVTNGTMMDAFTKALKANHDVAFRRSNADKRNAVIMALEEPAFKEKPSREIADMCGVGKTMVNDVIAERNGETKVKKRKFNPATKLAATAKFLGELKSDGAHVKTPSVQSSLKNLAEAIEELLNSGNSGDQSTTDTEANQTRMAL